MQHAVFIRARVVVVLMTLVILTAPETIALAATASEDRDAERVEKILRHLRDGRRAKAEKLIVKLESDAPRAIPRLRLAQARLANDREDYGSAVSYAEAAGSSDEEGVATAALAERLVGGAGSGASSEDLLGIVEELRVLLDASDDHDALRVRVCNARSLLAEDDPLSLRNPRMPEGSIKYLPVEEPGNPVKRSKPQLIAERDLDMSRPELDGIVGEARASFRATIDADGCFAKARLSKTTHAEFEAAALEKVQGWVYRPARYDGRPVAMHFRATVQMQADDPSAIQTDVKPP